jgi:hypothetical protein
MLAKETSDRSSSSYSCLGAGSIRIREDAANLLSTAQSSKRSRREASTVDALAATANNDVGHAIANASDIKELCKLVSGKVGTLDETDLPFSVVCIHNQCLWDQYLDHDDAPYPAKYMDQVDLTIFIVELPKTIHEFFAEEILLQLGRQSEFITSSGSGKVAHMEADKRIRPKDTTPGFGGLPTNVSWEDYGTVVIEVGLSQPWGGATGLDSKALRWYNARGETGLEYILCVKIDKTDGVVSGAQYKLFDVQALIASKSPVDFAAQAAVDFLNGPCQIQLSVERVLGIPRGVKRPRNVPRRFFTIDLATIRDEAIRVSL